MSEITENNTSVYRSSSLIKTGLRKSYSQLDILDFLIFLIPAVKFAEINLVGRLFASDLLLAAALPFLFLTKGRLLANPLPRTALILGLGWLLGQIATDLYRETAFDDYARGWAKIGFFLINFMALYLLLANSKRRILIYILGLSVGGFLSFMLNPNEFAADHPWKFGIGESVTLLFFLAAVFCYSNHIRGMAFAVVIIFFTALLNIYLGSRSLGGMCMLAVFMTMLQYTLTRAGSRQISIRPAQMMLVSVMMLIAVGGILEAYSYAAREGFLGLKAQQKYQIQQVLQKDYGAFGLILAGRSEILTSYKIIADSPIIGQGSWAESKPYAIERYKTLRQLGFKVHDKMLNKTLIATHSHMFGAWVEAGLLGGLFWIWVLLATAKTMFGLAGLPHPLLPLYAYLGISFAWTISFSPLGANGRMTSAALLAIILIILAEVNSFQSMSAKERTL